MGRIGVAFFLLVLLAAGAVAWLGIARSSPAPQVPSPTVPATGPAKGTDPGGTPAPRTGKQAPPPPEDPIAPTRAARLEYLERMAGPVPAPKGGGTVYLYPDVRADALAALSALPGYDATPLVLAALGGDGNPENWDEDRLRAAALRASGGHADGGETVKAFLRAEPDLGSSEAVAPAAAAAARMGAKEGGDAVRRLLAVKPDDWTDEECLAAVLQAAASLGAGATKEELLRYAHPKDDAFDALVRGAAAGALLRLGDESGMSAFQLVREDGFGEEDFATGLGAFGNEAAVAPLAALLADPDSDVPGRERAAFALAAIGGEKATAALRGALGTADAETSAAIAIALALSGDASGIDRVRAATGARDPDISIPAWRALAMAADAGSKEAAEKLLAEPRRSTGDPLHETGTRQRIWAALLLLKLEPAK